MPRQNRWLCAQMAKSLGLIRDGIRYHLDRMKAEGVIRFVGATRNGHWEIVNPQPPTGGPGS